jgi:hypothetical protein
LSDSPLPFTKRDPMSICVCMTSTPYFPCPATDSLPRVR